jgi:cytoplasmic tRNA 2-thiolation protein 1
MRKLQGSDSEEECIPRCKPFKYAYEKEIVMYAYFKKLDYFSTECVYAPDAYRGHARAFIKDLEKLRPSAIMDIIHSGERMRVRDSVRQRQPVQGKCARCGYISSMEVCKACIMLEGLNKGMPRLGVGKSSKAKSNIASRSPSVSLASSSSSLVTLDVSSNAEKLKKLEF